MASLLGMSVDVTIRLKNQKDESLTQVPSDAKVCFPFQSLPLPLLRSGVGKDPRLLQYIHPHV